MTSARVKSLHVTADSKPPDRENRIVADILSHFRDLVILATHPVNNTASAGQAAYSSMAMEIETKGLVSTCPSSALSHGARAIINLPNVDQVY